MLAGTILLRGRRCGLLKELDAFGVLHSFKYRYHNHVATIQPLADDRGCGRVEAEEEEVEVVSLLVVQTERLRRWTFAIDTIRHDTNLSSNSRPQDKLPKYNSGRSTVVSPVLAYVKVVAGH